MDIHRSHADVAGLHRQRKRASRDNIERSKSPLETLCASMRNDIKKDFEESKIKAEKENLNITFDIECFVVQHVIEPDLNSDGDDSD